MSIRIITNTELQILQSVLEECFEFAKGMDEIGLMVDLAQQMELITKLKKMSLEDYWEKIDAGRLHRSQKEGD